jgi:hypothetical protein
MATATELRHTVHEAQARLERARNAYRSAARRCLIAELLETLVSSPEITSLDLSAQYEYDDEGGYFRWLGGSVTVGADAAEGDELDVCWTEGLNIDQDVILELFGIDNVGEGTLTRVELEALAAEDSDDRGAR